MLRLVMFGLALQQASAIVYRLTPKEYDKLPKLTKIDDYGPCMRDPGDVYCFVTVKLHGNLSDPLYKTLVEYSANTKTHFDHTKINRGVCPKKNCAKHMNSSTNMAEVVEACLNETFTREYRLTAKIYDPLCEEYSESLNLDGGDLAFLLLVLGLSLLNVLGTLYDFFCGHGKHTLAGKSLLCFSVRHNWRKLVAPGSSSPMQRRIKVLHSIRTITAFLVILAHSPLPSILLGNNGQFIESLYDVLPFYILINGTLGVQTFFLMSGFLMAYNMLLSEERKPPSWLNFPRGVLLRWLRLTPPYALVMFFVMTWMRHLTHGPFYLKSVMIESNSCHKDWWRHLLYIHNYEDMSQCMLHGWYLGAEFQLSVVGLMVFCLLYSNRSRKIAIGLVTVVGLLTPAIHTYIQNLDPFLIVSPEMLLNFFVIDPTFNNLYKRGHTNLVCYGLGMAMAYMVIKLKDSDLGAEKFKKFRLLYWLLFPIMLLIVLVGSVFYQDIVIPIAVRIVYSSAVKIVFGFLNALFIFFTIVKVDSLFRGFLHWGGWARIARVTYLAYLVHVPVLRFSAANTDVLIPSTTWWMATNYMSCLCVSVSIAVPLFILVENPLSELIKVTMVSPRPRKVEHVKASKDTLEEKL